METVRNIVKDEIKIFKVIKFFEKVGIMQQLISKHIKNPIKGIPAKILWGDMQENVEFYYDLTKRIQEEGIQPEYKDLIRLVAIKERPDFDEIEEAFQRLREYVGDKVIEFADVEPTREKMSGIFEGAEVEEVKDLEVEEVQVDYDRKDRVKAFLQTESTVVRKKKR